MVNFARIQNKIYKGYGKAAERLGSTHAIYRSASAINPIQNPNLIGNQLISVDQDFTYVKARKYGDPTWQFMAEDGLSLQKFDFMVNSQNTYYIVDIKPVERLNPPICVECNTTLTITRPYDALIPGNNPPVSYQIGSAQALYTNCPASLIEGSRGDNQNMKLPTSVRMPLYKILLPFLGNVELKSGDIIQDAKNIRYALTSIELTGLGYRLQAAIQGV